MLRTYYMDIPFEGEYIVDGWWNLEALWASQANVRTKGQIILRVRLSRWLVESHAQGRVQAGGYFIFSESS